jgi:hypothetical protein
MTSELPKEIVEHVILYQVSENKNQMPANSQRYGCKADKTIPLKKTQSAAHRNELRNNSLNLQTNSSDKTRKL